jgi:hypothetical protein
LASEFIDVQGKVSWLHAVGFNRFDKWSVTLHPDTRSLEVIRDLQAQGIKNQMKKDDDGYYIQFSREPSKLMRGKVVAFAAPKVVDKDGVPIDGSRVGNGSDVTVRLEVYQHGTPNGGKAKAARFDSIRIDNLVPYQPDRDLGSQDEKDAVKSLTEAPEPLFN